MVKKITRSFEIAEKVSLFRNTYFRKGVESLLATAENPYPRITWHAPHIA